MYATVDQLVALFGERTVRELSNRGDPDALLETGVLEEAIRVAGSEVDSYLAASRPVPLAEPVPPVVTAVVADIVRYRLTSGDMDDNDAIVTRYNRALAWLQAKISALAALAAKPEQAALPEAVTAIIAPDVTLEQIESRITALRKYISKERHEIYVDLLDQLYTVKAVRAAMGKMIIVSSIGKAIHEELTRCISSNSDTLCQYDNPCVMVRDFKALLGE